MTTQNSKIEIVFGSVLEQDVDAVVNAANTAMQGGGGIDGVIHKAAGKNLLVELRKVAPNGAKTGAAVLTKGHNLSQPFILHVAGPVWKGGGANEADKLALSYRSCLEKADAKGLKSLAFCSISTGVYAYPLTLAAPLALSTANDFLNTHPDTSLELVVFALFQKPELLAFQKAWKELGSAAANEDA